MVNHPSVYNWDIESTVKGDVRKEELLVNHDNWF